MTDDRTRAPGGAVIQFISSSGDGLGIQQPGSNTLATRAKVKGQSGRADDSAMCPAVARSFSGRAL